MKKEVEGEQQLREEQVASHRRELLSREEQMRRLEEEWKQQEGVLKEAGRQEVS